MYNKLFTKILDSSIWLEDHATVRVWVTLLASMDETGMCQYASGLNLARRANVTTEEAAAAVKVLEAPDPHSSDPDHEGRRIERTRGGWIVLNAPKYRALVTRKESMRLAAERQQRYRDRKKKSVTNVTKRDEGVERNATVTQSEAEAEAEAVFFKREQLTWKRDGCRGKDEPSSVPGWTTRLWLRLHKVRHDRRRHRGRLTAVPNRGDESMNQENDNARQTGLTRLARAAHRRGMEPDQLNIYLIEANARRCVPPLHGAEVLAIAARTIEGQR